MASFITTHVTSCMTRQDLDRLLKRLLKDGADGEVRISRVRCDTLAGRMLCEWQAEDGEQLVAWLAQRNVRFRGSEEWCMRVQLESQDGAMVTA